MRDQTNGYHEGAKYPAPPEYIDIRARLFERGNSPNLYANWVDPETGQRTSGRSTGQSDPAEAWAVVASWGDVPRVDRTLFQPGPQATPTPVPAEGLTPAPAPDMAALAEAVAVAVAAALTQPQAPERDDETSDPVAERRAGAIEAAHARYRETRCQPTEEEIAAWIDTGEWLDPVQIEHWCDANGTPLRRDWWLALILLLPNAVSWMATATGLAMLLSVRWLAWPVSAVLTALNIAFSWGLVARHVRAKAKVFLLSLAAVSVFLGVPGYYGMVGGGAEESQADGQARAAFARLSAQVVPRVRADADAARARVDAAWKVAREEAQGTLGTGHAGDGPVARRRRQEARDLAAQLGDVIRLGQRVEQISEIEANSSPSQIYNRALALWALAPTDLNVPEPAREAYINEAQAAPFFLVYYRMGESSWLAWMTFFAAVAFDAAAVWMGLSVVRSRSSIGWVRQWSQGIGRVAHDVRWSQSHLGLSRPSSDETTTDSGRPQLRVVNRG